MSAAVAAILEGMPESRDLRMREHDGRCVITAGPVVLFEYAAGDIVMRNIALAALRQLGFRGRVVAAVLGLSEAYVATLHSAALRDGSAALIRQDRRGTPGKVTAAQREKARAWRDQGVSDAEIGRRLGIAHTTVSRGLGPRGQAPAREGEPGWAPAEPLFTEAGREPEREPAAEREPETEPVLVVVVAACRLAEGCRPGRCRPRACSRRGMPGRCCCMRSSRGRMRAARCPHPVTAGLPMWRCCPRSACASRWARARSSSSSTWPPPMPGRWPGWRYCRVCGRCGLTWPGSLMGPTR